MLEENENKIGQGYEYWILVIVYQTQATLEITWTIWHGETTYNSCKRPAQMAKRPLLHSRNHPNARQKGHGWKSWWVDASYSAASGKCVRAALYEIAGAGVELWTNDMFCYDYCITFHHFPPVTWEPRGFPSYHSRFLKAQALRDQQTKYWQASKMLSTGTLHTRSLSFSAGCFQ